MAILNIFKKDAQRIVEDVGREQRTEAAMKKKAERKERFKRKYKIYSKPYSSFSTKVGNILTRQRQLPAKRLAQSIGTAITGVKYGSKKGAKKSVGRPRGVYKHKHPITGKPLPATVYYKVVRRLKRRAKALPQEIQIRRQIALARRGITPQQAQQIQAQQQIQQGQQVRQMPRRMQRLPKGMVIMNGQQFKVETDILSGRKRLVPWRSMLY